MCPVAKQPGVDKPYRDAVPDVAEAICASRASRLTVMLACRSVGRMMLETGGAATSFTQTELPSLNQEVSLA